MTVEGCCGQPGSRRRRRPERAPLPPNPEARGGVRMLYLGSGRREVRGAGSGLTYVVTDHRRHFKVDPEDVDDLLESRDFMLQV
ncbi:MAG: hypothetical protein R6X29_04315 [Acidimicrobiia bacterium]